ncbi:VOC family protein [Streptomyces sp. LP05-1]|uniref:VOC family protein n=1 Tax=Streptomyces pyxinae TaxID=2970734 RepID=A0ABT2CE12_9ACTN|nr:VOC family protein [Streptomyces sp. LP05-1]MCS0635650.1 VOC family protein [Streptomyces sp. LP05-1]
MPLGASSHIRVARPCRDLAAAERFWSGGLGLRVVHRDPGGRRPGEHALLMLGWPEAGWHLELVHEAAHPVEPRPTEEDLLVVCLAEPVPAGLVARLEEYGGRQVASPNPYWNEWGVTIEDPDGYRLVLCARAWANTPVE